MTPASSSSPTSNLFPGSVWERRTRKNDVSTSVVICVTNDGLSTSILEKHPQQVVFLTDKEQILSITVSEFVRNRTYVGMSEKVAEAMGALPELVFGSDDEDEDEEINIDDIDIDETLFNDGADPDAGTEPRDDEEDEVESPPIRALSINVGPHPSKELLESSLVGYSESPYHSGDTLHTLSFKLGGGLTMEMVQAAFTSSDPNSIQKFEVQASADSYQVDIDGVIGVMLGATWYETTCRLYLTSPGDFRSYINADDSPQSPTDAQTITPISAPTLSVM